MTMSPMQRSIHVEGLAHNAPIPVGARVGPLVCSSAINGKDRASGILPADGAAQVRHAFANLQAFLQAAGAGPQHLAKLGISLKDDSLRGAINAEWNALFPDANDRPARHIVNQDLQHGMLIQLEAMAYVLD
jgi:2-iminobutanoate/2-iminopropanoate deaminase